jgi:hypothetical protein
MTGDQHRALIAAQRLAVPHGVAVGVDNAGGWVDVRAMPAAQQPGVLGGVVDGNPEASVGQHVRPAAGQPDLAVGANE